MQVIEKGTGTVATLPRDWLRSTRREEEGDTPIRRKYLALVNAEYARREGSPPDPEPTRTAAPKKRIVLGRLV